jgi:hypothetical protein
MSKNHESGLLDSMVAFRERREEGRAFLVPLRAAEMDREGEDSEEKGGGLKRLEGRRRPELRLRVGERPAAGAEAIVVDDLMKVSRRGVETTGRVERDLIEGRAVAVTFKVYCCDLAIDTSSSKADRLRLFKESSRLGSTFSPSEFPSKSGEGALRFNEAGAELGVMAV